MVTLTKEYQLLKEVYLGNTGWSNVYARLYAKYNSQDIPNNRTNVTVQLRIYTDANYWYQETGGWWAVGLTDNTTISGQANQSFYAGETVIGTITGNVSHNANGVRTDCACLGSVNFTAWGWSAVCDTLVTLPTIPRYTSITSFTVSKRNETSLSFNWQTADTIDYVWYSTNNGSSWTGYDVTDGKSGNFVVSGLSPNTTYNCKLRVRRKDSQLNTDSNTVSQTTYKAPTQSLSSKTETSITMNWSCDTTINHIWYSKDNGANWVDVGNVNATSGSYTINGLSANTAYNIKTRVRRSATNTTYDTSASSQTTYAYPYCTEAPDFTIGNNVTIKLYNPLNRTIKIQMWSHVSQQFVSELIEINGTSYTGFSELANRLYASIPNTTTSQYNIDVWYGTNKAVKNGGNYSITGNELPTFENFTYKDINSNVVNVTNNNQIIIKGLSNLEVDISSANKMVAKNSSNPNYYLANINNINAAENYVSGDLTINVGQVNSSGTQRLNVKAYDSRGLNTLIYKDIYIYDYSKPTINLSISRLNNYEDQTTLKCDGIFTPIIIDNNPINTISNVKYRYREINGTWSNWININYTINSDRYICDDVYLSLDNTKSFEFEIIVTDSFNESENESGTLDIGQAIFFISSNLRKCYINDKEILTEDYDGNVNINGTISSNNKEVLTNNYTGNAALTGTLNVIGKLQISGQQVLEYDIVDSW